MLRRSALWIAVFVALSGSTAAAYDGSTFPPPTDPSQTDPKMSAALELMDATNGMQMAAYQIEFVTNAYIAEYHQTHAKDSPEDVTLFAATLDDEASKSVQDVAMTFARSYADQFSEDDMHAMTAFAHGDLYTRFMSALPQPLSGLGLFNLLTVSQISTEPKAKKFAEIFGKFETPEDMQAIRDFIQTAPGQHCVAGLHKIWSEMTYTPGWLTKIVDQAKDRTIVRLRLKGVHL